MNPQPESIHIYKPGSLSNVTLLLRGYALIDARVKIAGYQEGQVEFPFGTTEEVSGIDKISVQSALSIFSKNGLPVIGVIGTNVN
jgi:hypothetical protein